MQISFKIINKCLLTVQKMKERLGKYVNCKERNLSKNPAVMEICWIFCNPFYFISSSLTWFSKTLEHIKVIAYIFCLCSVSRYVFNIKNKIDPLCVPKNITNNVFFDKEYTVDVVIILINIRNSFWWIIKDNFLINWWIVEWIPNWNHVFCVSVSFHLLIIILNHESGSKFYK